MSALAIFRDIPVAPDPAEAAALAARERIRALLAAAAYTDANPPPAQIPVMTLADVPVAHAGNLVVVEAQSKAGKTVFYCAGIASTFSDTGDFLGWESDGNPHGKAIVHFDSEQSRCDHDNVIRRALRRAGLDATPAWFASYCLTGWDLADAKDAVQIACEDAAARHGGLHSLWLDGGADFVASVNDEVEAIAWTRTLHGLAQAHQCPVFLVIHLNPASAYGADKSRGHLGSQLDRKAETVIRLTKQDEITSVATRYARGKPIPTQTGPQFAYSPEHQMHMSLGARKDAKAARDRGELLDLAQDAFRNFSDPFGMPWSDLAERIVKCRTVGKEKPSMATVGRRITGMLAVGVVRKNEAGNYRLVG